MDISDVLMASSMIATCDSYIMGLNDNNSKLEALASQIETVQNDTVIKGKSFDTVKETMSGFTGALRLMRAANDTDLADYHALRSAVGGENLVGSKIIPSMMKAKESMEKYRARAAYYRSLASSCLPMLSGFYNSMASMFEELANIQQTIYEMWKGKSETFDEINASTANLFTASVALRNGIENVLKDLDKVYGSGKYTANDMWKSTLNAAAALLENSLSKIKNSNRSVAGLKGKSNICIACGDPVNMSTGNFYYEKEDLRITGILGLSMKRHYDVINNYSGVLGEGWCHEYESHLEIAEITTNGEEIQKGIRLYKDDGKEIDFIGNQGVYHDEKTGLDEIEEIRNKEGIEYSYKEKSSPDRFVYDSTGKLISKSDKNGNKIEFIYDEEGYLTEAREGESVLLFSYDKKGMLNKVADHTGREVIYGYEEREGRKYLTSVTGSDGNTVKYTYGLTDKMRSLENGRGIRTIVNEYDEKGRVIKQIYPDKGEAIWKYDDKNRQVTFTEQNGNQVIYEHDSLYRNVKTIYADSEEIYEYNVRNQRTGYIDRNGNRYRFSYDVNGNLTQSIAPDRTKTNMTYDAEGRLLNLSVNGVTKIKNSYDSKGNLTESIDAIGRKVKREYNSKGQAERITLSDGSVIKVCYDIKGNIKSVTDAAQSETGYEYDQLNRVVKTRDGNGNVTEYEYDAKDRIVKVINAEGNERRYKYNASGKVEKLTDFDGESVSMSYNELNEISCIRDKSNREIHRKYDIKWNLCEEEFPGGAVRKYIYDKESRLIKEENYNKEKEKISVNEYSYDKNGNVISKKTRDARTEEILSGVYFEYDCMNRVIKKCDEEGSELHYIYNDRGLLIETSDKAGNSIRYEYNDADEKVKETDENGNETIYEYTNLGKVKSITDSLGNSTRYEYEAGGRLKREISATGNFVEYSYDKNGNVVKKEYIEKDGSVNSIEYEYDSMNRVVKIKGDENQTTGFTYDANGNVIIRTDESGNKSEYKYSVSGKLIKVKDEAGNEAEYKYDELDNLKKIIRHGTEDRITEYTRDCFGNVIGIKDQLGNEEHYEYDAIGRMIKKTDKDGYETKYSYARDGKLVLTEYADETTVRMEYDALRRLVMLEDSLGITRIKRDEHGRIEEVEDPSGKKTAYTWGVYGERKSITTPDNKKTEYQYDNLMRLTSLAVKGEDAGDESIVRYVYDANGRLSQKELPEGIKTTYLYNSKGMLERLKHEDDKGILDEYVYEYDTKGRKSVIIKNRRGLREESGRYEYSYDPLGRLSKVVKDNELLRTYEFDEFSNRRYMKDYKKEEEVFYSYNVLDQLMGEDKRRGELTEETRFKYDRRGNLTEKYKDSELIGRYEYGVENRLNLSWNKEQEAEYIYNGFLQRTGKTIYDNNHIELSSESYVLDITKPYNNLLMIEETTGQGIKNKTFTYDNKVVMQSISGINHVYMLDEMGSPLRVSDYDKEYLTYGYDEYGRNFDWSKETEEGIPNPYAEQGEEQPFGYTGYRYDETAGSYYAQAREYLPEAGRFMAVDEVKGNIITPISQNSYIYCQNNSLDYVDLDGRTPCDVDGIDNEEAFELHINRFNDEALWSKKQLENVKPIDFSAFTEGRVQPNKYIANEQLATKYGSGLTFEDYVTRLHEERAAKGETMQAQQPNFPSREEVESEIETMLSQYPERYTGTETIGISVALTPGVFLGDVSIGISIDGKGNFAIQATTGVAITGGTRSASIGVFTTTTKAPDVFALEGEGNFVGGSTADPLMVGADAVIVGNPNHGPNYGGVTFTAGVGMPGAEGHAGISTYTWTLMKGNYNEWILNGIYGKPEEVKCE